MLPDQIIYSKAHTTEARQHRVISYTATKCLTITSTLYHIQASSVKEIL